MAKSWKKRDVEELELEWDDKVRFEVENVHSPPTLSLDPKNGTAKLTMVIKTGDGVNQPYYESAEVVDKIIDAYAKSGWTLAETEGLMCWEGGEERAKWITLEKEIKIPEDIVTAKQLFSFLKRKAEE